MKAKVTQILLMCLSSAAIQAHAAAAADNLNCTGSGYTIAVNYAISVTDSPRVSMKIQKDSSEIINVSTDDAGNAVNFIHDSYTTPSEFDNNGNLIHYGKGIAPKHLLAFTTGETQPLLYSVNLNDSSLSIDGKVVTKLKCKSIP